MNQEIIEKYIDCELSSEERSKFENLLSIDSRLETDYNLSLEINNSIVEDDIMNLRDTLSYMYNNEPVIKRIPNRISNRRLAYAASIASLLLAGGITQHYVFNDMDNVSVYEKYYFPYDATVTYRSGNVELDKIFIGALQKYENKEFEEALALFEVVLEKRTDDMALNLYTGISYMEEDEYQKASNSFNKIIDKNNNLFIEQAKWYLALCYVITEEDDKATALLEEIIEEDSHYKKQARKMLKDLN